MSGSQERTESATTKRRERARTEGDVARSAFAPTAAVLLFSFAPLEFARPFARWWIAAFVACAHSSAAFAVGDANVVSLARGLLSSSAPWSILAVSWLGALLAAIAAASACGTIGWSPAALRWRAARLSLAAGVRSLVSGASAWQASIALVAACSVVVCAIPAVRLELAGAAVGIPLDAQPKFAVSVIGSFWWRTCAALTLIAAVDVVVSRRRHAARLRMTRQEVRDERIEQEGKPELKARRRSIGMRRSRGVRITAIKEATAVVTNPTHVSVALRYAPPAIDVPLVVSSATELGAMLIRMTAELHGVPIVESPELARALHARVDVDEPIPEEFYAAVAALFAWILKTRGMLRGAQAQ